MLGERQLSLKKMNCSAVYKHEALGEFLRTLKAKHSRALQTYVAGVYERQVGEPLPWQRSEFNML